MDTKKNFPDSSRERLKVILRKTECFSNEESQAASSKADFYNKIKISLKESRETKYWLKMLKYLKLGDQQELTLL